MSEQERLEQRLQEELRLMAEQRAQIKHKAKQSKAAWLKSAVRGVVSKFSGKTKQDG